MQPLTAKFLLALLIGSSVFSGTEPTSPTSPFDRYGAISWENEKARLDNLAIHLLNYNGKALGFILVHGETGGCPGEPQARAIRAKRYMVEHRRVPWHHVIWRHEGYRSDITTTLLVAPQGVYVRYPFYESTRPAVDGPMTKVCRARLERIRRSRW